MGLAQMYLDHPDYKNFYNSHHPDMVEFLLKAMKVYLERELF